MKAFRDGIADLATPDVVRMYAPNEVPKKPTYPYAVMDVTLGRGDAYTLNVAHGMRWVEVIVQTFGHTSNAAADVMERFIVATMDQRPTVAGWDVGPLQLDLSPTSTSDNDDSGVVGRTAVLVATATKEA